MIQCRVFSSRLVTNGLYMALTCLTIAACTSKPPPARSVPARTDPMIAPTCRIEGCCQGHGDVAYMQPDKIIMCTDGEPSAICDCH